MYNRSVCRGPRWCGQTHIVKQGIGKAVTFPIEPLDIHQEDTAFYVWGEGCRLW